MGSEAPHRWFPLDVTPLFNQAAISGVAGSTAGNHAGIQLVDRGGTMIMHLALLPSAYSKPKPSSVPFQDRASACCSSSVRRRYLPMVHLSSPG